LVLERRGSSTGNLKKQIYSYRKIRAKHQGGTRGFDRFLYAGNLAVPARSPNHHIFPGTNTCLDMWQNCMRGREVNYGIDVMQFLRGQRGTLRILRSTEHRNLMAALARDFRYQ
jgi:hypothetical protein